MPTVDHASLYAVIGLVLTGLVTVVVVHTLSQKSR
jgi:hypothetical protein